MPSTWAVASIIQARQHIPMPHSIVRWQPVILRKIAQGVWKTSTVTCSTWVTITAVSRVRERCKDSMAKAHKTWATLKRSISHWTQRSRQKTSMLSQSNFQKCQLQAATLWGTIVNTVALKCWTMVIASFTTSKRHLMVEAASMQARLMSCKLRLRIIRCHQRLALQLIAISQSAWLTCQERALEASQLWQPVCKVLLMQTVQFNPMSMALCLEVAQLQPYLASNKVCKVWNRSSSFKSTQEGLHRLHPIRWLTRWR